MVKTPSLPIYVTIVKLSSVHTHAHTHVVWELCVEQKESSGMGGRQKKVTRANRTKVQYTQRMKSLKVNQ